MVAVYRAYAASGSLLYVGLSKFWPRRWAQHDHQLVRNTARLEITWVTDLREARRLEAEWIHALEPLWNKRAERAPDCWYRCDACGMGYSSIQMVSEMVQVHNRELWSVAGLCNDMSGHGGTLERPCRGPLVAA